MSDARYDEAKGRAKEAVGSLAGDEELKEEGRTDQRAASVKEKVDEAGTKIKDKVDDVKRRLTD
jgi:uncharacterized protein YjbJ (UPF0337 family)